MLGVYMDITTVRITTARWQTRLRLLALLALMGLTGMTTSMVMAEVESEPATPAIGTEQTTESATPVEGASLTAPDASAASDAAATAQTPDESAAAETAAFVEPERFGVREMFEQADMVVKAVMIFLVFCSLLTWAVLLDKIIVFARARRANNRFLQAFRQGDGPTIQELADNSAMGRMWKVAQAEVGHFGRREANADQINRLLQRMSLTSSIVQERDLARLGSMMGVLATIGATAPFIGLFGTVWGILNSFASIATMKSASLAIVAPGIAEALLATALGLFAAIPAVMIFNKFARDINGFVGALDNFSAEMIADVSRKLDEAK